MTEMNQSKGFLFNKAPYSSIPKDKTLPFNVIKEKVDELILATTNRIDQDWPPPLTSIGGMKPLLLLFVKVAENTYHTVRYFCADSLSDSTRKPEFGLSATPLVRTLLDQVYSLVFISIDPSQKVPLYYNGGWKEMREAFIRYKKKYDANPAWKQWLDEKGKLIEWAKSKWDVPQKFCDDNKKGPYWPTPSQIIGQTDGREKAFLEHLDDWFYKEYSQSAHLSFPGLSRRGGPLLIDDTKYQKEVFLKSKSDAIFSATTLVLAILSEIEGMCQFDYSTRLQYPWTVIGEYWPETKELYEMRYQSLLAGEK